MSTEPGKNNDGFSLTEGGALPIQPKADDKSTGGHMMQPPPIFTFGAGLPSSGVHIPDSPIELPGDPLKEGARARMDEASSDIEKGNPLEALRRLDPTMNAERLDAHGFFFTTATSGEPLSEDSKQQVIGKWKQSHTPQDEAIGIIEASPLSTKDKVDMIALANKELSSMSKEETQEFAPQNEQDQMKATMGATGEQLDQEQEKLKQELSDAKGHSGKDEHAEHKHHSERVERLLERVEELREKIDEFLHPEDPLKTWATRGGKTLYVILMLSFLFIIWEMSVINKMAGGKRGH